MAVIQKKKVGSSFAYTAVELDALCSLVGATKDSGISRSEALKAMPMHSVRMQFLLRLLCERGRLGSVGQTRWTRYYLPAVARAVANKARAERHDAEYSDAERAEREPCPVPIRRVIVKASQAERLKPAGPRSVFELATVAA